MSSHVTTFEHIVQAAEAALEAGMSLDDFVSQARAQYRNAQEHAAAGRTRQARRDWDLVCAFLHHSGSHRDALNATERDTVWLLANGFGVQPLQWIRENCYDWSHVRDSTPEAIAAMADQIRTFRQGVTMADRVREVGPASAFVEGD